MSKGLSFALLSEVERCAGGWGSLPSNEAVQTEKASAADGPFFSTVLLNATAG